MVVNFDNKVVENTALLLQDLHITLIDFIHDRVTTHMNKVCGVDVEAVIKGDILTIKVKPQFKA